MAVSTSAHLLAVYNKVLGSSGVTVNENGNCYITMLGLNQALIVEDKTVVLPIDAVMKQFNIEANMAFHPLSESVIRAESPVISKLKQLMTFRLAEVIQLQLATLVELAADTARHKNLTPEQQVFLLGLPKADGKTAKAVDNITPKDLAESLSNVLDANGSNPKHTVLHMFLKRSGNWKGRKYKRVCIVNFPIMEAEQSKDNVIFGVKVRVNDKPAILNLFKYILPGSDEAETPYNYGSDSGIAPYFDALIHAFLAVAKQLNITTELFKQHISDADYATMCIDTSWEADVEDLAQYKGLIGPMEGNIGDQSEEEKVQSAATTTVLSTPVSNGLQHALVQATPPAPTVAQVSSARKTLEYNLPAPTAPAIPMNPHVPAGYPVANMMPMMMPQAMPQMMQMPQAMPQNNVYALALSNSMYDRNAAPVLMNGNSMVMSGPAAQPSMSAGRRAEMEKQQMAQMNAYGNFGGNPMGVPQYALPNYYQQPVQPQLLQYAQPVQQQMISYQQPYQQQGYNRNGI